MRSRDLSKIIRNVEDLPTLPRNIVRITELINNPRSSAKELSTIITDDQVLTARLLKLVNSSFYGFPQKISTVTGAIVLLGFDAIRNLLLTTSIFELFAAQNGKGKFKRELLWDHSLGCALGAKIIGNFLRYDTVEELFVSGLLHDIGKIVEMFFAPKDFARVISEVEKRDVLMITAEDEVLGYNHTEVGKLLAERWNLPANLVNVIAYHHCPEQAGKFMGEAAIIHVANILCRAMDMGSGGDKRIPRLNKHAWDILRLPLNSVEPIMEEMGREFEDMSSFITHSR